MTPNPTLSPCACVTDFDSAAKLSDARRSLQFIENVLCHVRDDSLDLVSPENLGALLRVIIASFPETEL